MKSIRLIAATLACVCAGAGTALAGAEGFCYNPDDRAGYVCPPCTCAQDGKTSKAAGACTGCGTEMVARKDLTHVAVLLYDGVELVDVTGPTKVLNAAGYYVYTVSLDGKPLRSTGISMTPAFNMHTCPWPDILVVPGGGTDRVPKHELVQQWIRAAGAKADMVTSTDAALDVVHRRDGEAASR